MSPSDPMQTPARRGHHPVIPARAGSRPEPLPADVVDAFREVPLTDLSDAVGALYTMTPRLRPLYQPMRRVVGTATTVKVPVGDNWAIHGALKLAQPGMVLVIDWRGSAESCGAGVEALLPAVARGLAGIVVDGSWRDVPEIAAVDFPIIGLGNAPYSPPKEKLGEINVPVSCGGVVVAPGDLIVGDHEGVVVIPRAYVDLVRQQTPPHERATPARVAALGSEPPASPLSDDYWNEFERAGGIAE